jgi:hypothetical protein
VDAGRLSRGELIAGIAGLALFIFMFFSWFGSPSIAGDALDGVVIDLGLTANAWQAFDFIDLVLLLTVIVSVGFAIAAAAAKNVNLPVAGGALTAGLGIIATLLVLYRIIDPPFNAGREIGVWLGLIASAGVAFGGWTAMQEQGGGPVGGGAARRSDDAG